MHNKPKIGMLGLTLDKYDLDLKKGRAEFARKLVKTLEPYARVDFQDYVDTREKAEEQVRCFENNNYDGILVILLTYAPSLIASRALINSKLPITIWNTQEATGIPVTASPTITSNNHGVHGVQDLSNVLKRENKKFSVVTGHFQDHKTLEQVGAHFKAMKAKRVLENSRIGLIGYSMQDMGDFNIDETAILNQLGPSIRHIPIDELADLIEDAPEQKVNNIVISDQESFEWEDTFKKQEIEMAARMEWAIRRLIEKYRLKGWAQHFFSLGSSKRIKMLPFLAASKLMSEGIGYGAEGDATAAAAFILVYSLAGEANFTEMFTMDFEDGSVLMRHMGEGNIGLAREDSPIKIVENSFKMIELMPTPSPVFLTRPGEATLVSLTTGANGKFQLVVARGEVTDFPGMESAVSQEYKWRPRLPLPDFLTAYAEAGGSHHQAMGYGDLTYELNKLERFMNIKVITIC